MQIGKNTALLIIDFQKGLKVHPAYGIERNNPDAERITASLLQSWRQLNLPVVHVKHNSTNSNSPLRPGQYGNEIREEVWPEPGEILIEKEVNCAFIGTSLEKTLHELQVNSLIITGMVSEHCVASTTMVADNLGFHTYLVSDATATFEKDCLDGTKLKASQVHQYMLSFLHGEFTQVVTSAEVFQLLDEN